MQLKNLIVIPPKIEFGETLQAIETAIPPLSIEQAIEHTQSKQQRNRILPTHVIVALVIAMNLWSKDSIEDAFQNLVQGLSSAWISIGQRWQRPSKSSLSEARQRVGPRVMSELFSMVARPLATQSTPGAFLKGLRLMAVDGTCFEVADTRAFARVFGYPGTRAT